MEDVNLGPKTRITLSAAACLLLAACLFIATGAAYMPANLASPAPSGSVDVTSFGAACDGGVDDTTAVQSAVAYAMANHLALHWPSCKTVVTQSINATANNASQNLVLYGEGKMTSGIACKLSESYPCLDLSGNGRAVVRDMGVINVTGDTGTAAILIEKGTNQGGNGTRIQDCAISGGHVAGDSAIVIANADLSRVIDTEVSGTGAGVTVGFASAANVHSKFITTSSQFDATNFYFTGDEITGSAGPALDFNGSAAITLEHSYFAITGSGAAGKIIRVSRATGSPGDQVFFYNSRTENQSSATGVSAIWFDGISTGGVIQGALSTDTNGYMIGSAPGANLANYDINVNGNSANFLNIAGGLARSRVVVQTGGAHNVGVVSDLVDTYDLEIHGNFRDADLKAVFGTIVNGPKYGVGSNL